MGLPVSCPERVDQAPLDLGICAANIPSTSVDFERVSFGVSSRLGAPKKVYWSCGYSMLVLDLGVLSRWMLAECQKLFL